VGIYAKWIVAALSLSGTTHAQTVKDTATTGSAEGQQPVSETLDALPGVHRIGLAGGAAPKLTAAGGLSYGYTEPQNGEPDPHHRLGGSLSAGIAPWSFAAAALRMDFRHDMHGGDAIGGDSGSVLDLTPILRAGGDMGDGLRLGGELRARFSGAQLATSVPFPDLDGRLLFSYTRLPSWAFASYAGYRLGQRGAVVDEAANLRPGDRVALGISEFDAVLLGVGMSKRISNTELLGEVTLDYLIGSDAPPLNQSPFRISLGARHQLSDNLGILGMVEVLPLDRAPSLADSPLVPIEPRFTIQAGLTYSFGKKKKEPPPPQKKEEEEKAKGENEKAVEAPPPVAKKIIPGSIQVTVVDGSGHPISDAMVTIEFDGKDGREKEKFIVPLQQKNIYVLDEVLPGTARLKIEADLLREQTRAVTIVEGTALEMGIQLSSEGSVGAQLRGLVRAYSGAGLKASVRVEPGGHEAVCDDSGEFEINLPPGTYEVIISAEGYSEQRRKLSVGEEGVTVLNADLQSSSK
jgi:hypothetical protein